MRQHYDQAVMIADYSADDNGDAASENDAGNENYDKNCSKNFPSARWGMHLTMFNLLLKLSKPFDGIKKCTYLG